MAGRIGSDADAVREELGAEGIESPLLGEIIAGIRERAERGLGPGG